MKREWTTEEIITHFTLPSEEKVWLGSNERPNHLGKAFCARIDETTSLKSLV